MKITTALMTLLCASTAMAEVTIYGSIRTGVELTRVSGAADTSKNLNTLRLADEGSRMGFKGRDKLDNGLELFWQVENRIRVGSPEVSATDGWSTRNRFIGVKGNWGKVYAGETDDLIVWAQNDFYWATTNNLDSDAAAISYIRRGDARDRAIYLESANLNGFNMKAEYAFSNMANGVTAAGKTSTQDPWKAAATAWYKNDKFALGAGYKYWNDQVAVIAGISGMKQSDGTTTTTSSNSTLTKAGANTQLFLLGGTLTPLSGLAVSAAWQAIRVADNGTDYRQQGYGAGVMYNSGKWTWNAAYAALGDIEKNGANQDQTGAYGIQTGVSYALSKQSKLQAGYNFAHNDTKSKVFYSRLNELGSTGAQASSVVVAMRTDF